MLSELGGNGTVDDSNLLIEANVIEVFDHHSRVELSKVPSILRRRAPAPLFGGCGKGFGVVANFRLDLQQLLLCLLFWKLAWSEQDMRRGCLLAPVVVDRTDGVPDRVPGSLGLPSYNSLARLRGERRNRGNDESKHNEGETSVHGVVRVAVALSW